MPVCKRCESILEAEELVRHESGDLLFVHCPSCGAPMGTYREPGATRRSSGPNT